MTFPFDWRTKELENADFDLFGTEFSETVSLFLPFIDVYFASPHAGGDLEPAWKAGVEMVRSEQKPVVDVGQEEYLYLPLKGEESLVGVAVLKNEKGTYENASSSWLMEKSRLITREMTRIKQYALDPVSGLPGGRLLQRRLDQLAHILQDGKGGFDCYSLILLEIHPRARDGEEVMNEIVKSSAGLAALIGHLFTPCHFGNGIYGLLWEDVAENQALKMGDMLLRWLKREGFPCSQIGIRSFANHEKDLSGESLLDECWQALHIARKRGPFALCSYFAVSNPEAHPLCPPPSQVESRLVALWKKEKNFALVLLHSDQDDKINALTLPPTLQEPMTKINDHEVFVYLAGADSLQVKEWCRNFQEWASLEKLSFSIGAALYPHHDFRKIEIPINCRKALLHTMFFGPGSITLFDAVSLNISGDIYYNEGDLSRAVYEYRRGLQIDAENVNLLNSLGVTFAQMNLYQKAIPLFEEALLLNPADSMALFNLGLAHLARGDEGKALENFEKVLPDRQDNFDLLLQLGKLYCKVGRYQEAVNVLLQGEQLGPVGVRDVSHGAVYRYLGEAYKGLGENSKAMASLQRACRHNARDAAALSMLGELYCLERQGRDIALSFCLQAVELDSSDWTHWGRLSYVLKEQGDYGAALDAVKKGLAIDRKNSRLFYLLGSLYLAQGKKGLASKMFKKVKKTDVSYREAEKQLAELTSPK